MKTLAPPSAGEEVEQLELVCMLVGCEMVHGFGKKSGSFLELNIHPPH